jgi:hypothetical protein
VNIRTFERGDEAVQVAIYNEAAAALPKFKPATVQEVQRRVTARDFDSSMRFFAVEGGQAVAYVLFNPNGRISFPWCRKGHEAVAEPLFHHLMEIMHQRGVRKAFAAYRADWVPVVDFFRDHGFAVAREMINFTIDLLDMPTAPARRYSPITPLERGDVPALFALAPHALRSKSALDLEAHLFDNPYFRPSAVFVLRSQRGGTPVGAGILVNDSTYADPKMVDPAMPCFRLGAFGTEGMQTKRIKGLFSFLCRDDAQCGGTAVDLMAHAAHLLRDSDDISVLAGQVPSNVPSWLRFYQLSFRQQGSFPVLERDFRNPAERT